MVTLPPHDPGFPYYTEYRCRDHPEDGWLDEKDAWYQHMVKRHGIGVSVGGAYRKLPLPRPVS